MAAPLNWRDDRQQNSIIPGSFQYDQAQNYEKPRHMNSLQFGNMPPPGLLEGNPNVPTHSRVNAPNSFGPRFQPNIQANRPAFEGHGNQNQLQQTFNRYQSPKTQDQGLQPFQNFNPSRGMLHGPPPRFMPSASPSLQQLGPPNIPQVPQNMAPEVPQNMASEVSPLSATPRFNQPFQRFPLVQQDHPLDYNQLQVRPTVEQNFSETRMFQSSFSSDHMKIDIPSQNKQTKETAEVTNADMQAKEDQMWINKWLVKKQKNPKLAVEKPSLKICEAQEKTRHMIVLLAKLQKNKQILETLKNEDRSIWEQKLKEVTPIKSELEKLQAELTCENNVKQLQRRIEKRRKKREKIKHHKKEMYEKRQEELVARQQKRAEIDKALQQIIEKQKLEKQEKDMQKEADEILGQVRKKITEASKTVQLVQGLQKLRKLRTGRLERQGVLGVYERGQSSTSKLMFEAKLANILQLLDKQLEVYNAEEAALKVHLETEQEETREKEREKTRQKILEKQAKERQKEEKMLFGSQKDPVPGDPIYSFRQYYDAASHSLEALVAIRREWDSYLTRPDLGSSIPDRWVIPPEPSSEAWASALNT